MDCANEIYIIKTDAKNKRTDAKNKINFAEAQILSDIQPDSKP